eukprot:1086153-Prymnesium_polylepis.1
MPRAWISLRCSNTDDNGRRVTGTQHSQLTHVTGRHVAVDSGLGPDVCLAECDTKLLGGGPGRGTECQRCFSVVSRYGTGSAGPGARGRRKRRYVTCLSSVSDAPGRAGLRAPSSLSRALQ